MLIFEPGTDIMEARQVVQERVAAVTPTLPAWAAPPHMIQPLSSTSRVMKIGISSDTLDTIALSQLARWKIRDNLMSVPGVANVAVWGNRKTQYQVQVDPARLRKHGVTVSQVMDADRRRRGRRPADVPARRGPRHRGVRGDREPAARRSSTSRPSATPRTLGEVTVRNQAGKVLRIEEVADVKIGHQLLIGDAVIDGGPGLLLVVEKFPWANTLQVTQRGGGRPRPDPAGPPDVQVDSTIFRPATFIQTSISNLTKALLSGCGWSSWC